MSFMSVIYRWVFIFSTFVTTIKTKIVLSKGNPLPSNYVTFLTRFSTSSRHYAILFDMFVAYILQSSDVYKILYAAQSVVLNKRLDFLRVRHTRQQQYRHFHVYNPNKAQATKLMTAQVTK